MHKVLIAGSFDPVTVGHLDMIRRSAPLCEQLDIGVIKNYSKHASNPYTKWWFEQDPGYFQGDGSGRGCARGNGGF